MILQVKQQVQRDPDYSRVHQAIIDMVSAQPPSVQRTLFNQLDSDPQSYLEAYQYFKQRLSASAPSKGEAPPQVSQTIKDKPPESPQRSERAPILESGGVENSPDSLRLKRQKIDKAKARALREGSIEALQSFLEEGGFLEHLK
jgi:hypothetical protein